MSAPATEIPPYRRTRLDPATVPAPPEPRRRKTTPLEILLFGVFALMLFLGGMAVYSSRSSSSDAIPNTIAEGMRRDRVNLVLIGVGGELHPGKDNLADAIILLSLKPSTKQAALVSIPRDFNVSIPGHGQRRLNEAHLLGEQTSYRGGGPGMVIDRVREITGQPVDGFARIDFAAFERIVDALGGVDIYVYRPFRDYLFKDTFHQGWQRMNGERALRYARYRYVMGVEGSNYARELRQQQIISAVRSRLQKLSAADAMRLAAEAMSISKYTRTNVTPVQMVQLYRIYDDMKPGNLRHVSLQPTTEIIESPGKNGEISTLVVPKRGDFGPLRKTLAEVFSDMSPVATAKQIQLRDGAVPSPSEYIGDDALAKEGIVPRRQTAAPPPAAPRGNVSTALE